MTKRTVHEYEGHVEWVDESCSWTVKSVDGKDQDIAESLSSSNSLDVHVRVEVTPVRNGWHWTRSTNRDGDVWLNGRIGKYGPRDPVCAEVVEAADSWRWRVFGKDGRCVYASAAPSKREAKRAAEKAWAEKVKR